MLQHVSEFNFEQITKLFFGSQRFKTGSNNSPLLTRSRRRARLMFYLRFINPRPEAEAQF